MKCVVIYPDNSACIDGQYVNDPGLLRRLRIPASRPGPFDQSDSALRYKRGDTLVVAFRQPGRAMTQQNARVRYLALDGNGSTDVDQILVRKFEELQAKHPDARHYTIYKLIGQMAGVTREAIARRIRYKVPAERRRSA